MVDGADRPGVVEHGVSDTAGCPGHVNLHRLVDVVMYQQVRKLLCHNCNMLLGHSRENIGVLLSQHSAVLNNAFEQYLLHLLCESLA